MGILGVWPGSDAERDDLNKALMRNCDCAEVEGIMRQCQAHSLLSDSRVLNHLVYVRRNAGIYIGSEWDTGDVRE